MGWNHCRVLRALGKALLVAGAAFGILPSAHAARPLTILLDQSPATLNPRMGMDASGQHLNALLLRALSRIDKDLEPRPDLAEKWSARPNGKNGQIWRFDLRSDLRDQAGEPITAQGMATCLENYRIGKPVSAVASDFSHWKETHAVGNAIEITLSRPDPYLIRNLSLLRYFRARRADATPCAEPKPSDVLIGSGKYQVQGPWRTRLEDESELNLIPASGAPSSLPALRFVFVQDDNTKGIQMLRGEIDVAPSSISPTKQRWLVEKHADRFRMITREGIRVYYLGFNTSDPVLKKPEVRQAIAYALDRDEFLRTKFRGFGSPSGSLLSPLLPESYQAEIPFDPARSEKLLDAAGFPRGKDGIRLRLRYKTTSVRDGYERAIVFREMLRRIGVELQLEIVEPAVFFAQVRKGLFQLYSSSWLGISDASIFDRTLHSGDQNRYKYANPEMDRLVDQALGEMDLGKRKKILEQVQKLAATELPFLPLWFSSNTVVVKKSIQGLEGSDLSLSGALEPLTRLRYDSSP